MGQMEWARSRFNINCELFFCGRAQLFQQSGLWHGTAGRGKTISLSQVTTSPMAAAECLTPSLALFPAVCERGNPTPLPSGSACPTQPHMWRIFSIRGGRPT